MKVITLIARKPGTSRAAFKAYYEDNHAPLGTRYFPFDKYVRNHVVSSVPDDVGFDVLMESWLDRQKALGILTSEIEHIFDEDEARFMDAPPRPAGLDVVEYVVQGKPRGVDPRGVRKLAWFLKADGLAKNPFLHKAADWGKVLAAEARATRIVIDDVAPNHDSPFFSGDAILTLWADDAVTPPMVPPPAGVAVQATLVLESHETTPEELKADFGKR